MGDEIVKKVKLEEVFSSEFIKGLKTGLRIAKDVAKRDNIELIFPNIDELEVKKHVEKKDAEKPN